MSSGLMSCVRENSPPLELDTTASGPLSLPETHSSGVSLMGTTSTPVTAASLLTTTSDGAAPNAEQKRRRFHPLRNLRRIFRRRTITSVADTPSNTSLPTSATPTNCTASEKNLRSATLSSVASVASASSPSSPLTHAQLQDAYSSQSLPKSKSYSNAAAHEHRAHRGDASLLSKNNKLQQQHQQQPQQRRDKSAEHDEAEMYATSTTTSTSTASYHHGHSQRFAYMSGVDGLGGAPPRQSLGVAVFPAAMNRSFFAERQKLRSVGDSSLDLDSSGNDSGSHTGRSTNTASGATTNGGGARPNGGGGGSASGGEMSDSQRSLSEGRLVDSDYTRDQLSQSHDSVFSESATASSLSIVLKAELADVLRKRRNRPDASDEDLGLPRSPASPQRRADQHTAPNGSGAHNHTNVSNTTGGNQSEVSSLSLLSMNSTDGEDISGTAAVSADGVQERMLSTTRYARSSTMSSISVSSDIMRHSSNAGSNDSKDEVDLFSSNWQRLSHSAAKHKMAVRPTKKKVPSRQHRRTLETSIPEANEESLKLGAINHLLDVVDHDAKAKTRSLPPGVNAKIMEQHVTDTKKTPTPTAKTSSAATAKTATTTSTPIAVSGDLAIKRSKNERGPTVVATVTSNSKISTTNTTTTTSTSSGSATTNLFGLRTLSSKAAAMFEPKETVTTSNESEKPKKSEDSTSSVTHMETTESGFLRRLMQRNSKRTIAKAREGEKDDLDMNQSEPKKLQISTSTYEVKTPAYNLPMLDKSRSEMTYEQNIEETRKEIKREIMSEGKSGLSAMLNNFMSAEKSQVAAKESALQKPKSGPAARQRYMPQEIIAGNTLEKKTLSPMKESSSSASLLTSKNTHSQETFQSTSIIREITASQQLSALSATNSSMGNSTRSEHHFEKKPKIVGLSAFQQKITRSSDSFARTSSTNTSSNSLETVGSETLFASYEQKQRRSVEKSRSFRTYNEDTTSSTIVHSNMPSLPDLSLNLRVPCFGEFILNEKEYSSPSPPEPDSHDKSVSLGFEINDNNLVRPALRAESASHLLGSQSSYAKNIILTTTAGSSKSSTTKLLTPASGMPSLSPTTSCNKNISEIEQNIDMIVKSPYVSVLRKSANITEEMAAQIPTTGVVSSPVKSEKSLEPVMKPAAEKVVRPKVLNLKERITVSEDKITTPTTAAVPLREKSSRVLNAIRSTVEVGAASAAPKELVRKSAPVSNSSSKTNISKTAIRSSSVVESVTSEDTTKRVPEFMKIQLNRVDPVRIAKSNVVLAKNVKESSSPTSPSKDAAEKSASIDDLSLRRYSNESVDITEKETPDLERRISGVFEAINKQAKSISTSNIQQTNTNTNDQLPPRSPVKSSPLTAIISPITSEEVAVLRPKTSETTATSTLASNNKLSLQERKRLFMSEDRSVSEKKMEDLRNERKKSITEEVYRKSSSKLEEKHDTTSVASTASSPLVESVESPAAVVLRKKSFGAISQSSSQNGNVVASNVASIRSNDPTPELMKVFARRSLKIKDEDLNAFQEKLNTHQQLSTTSITSASSSTTHSSSTTSVKKFASTPMQSQQNVDSDKENQSSSEEKLDKLPKFEVAIEQLSSISKVANTAGTSTSISTTMNTNGSNRNSVADFRAAKNGVSNSNGLTINNNNNNNNMTITSATTTLSNGKSFLPPLRVGGGFRTIPIERNGSVNKLFGNSAGVHNNSESLNNNNNALNNNGVSRVPPLERQSLNIKSSESASAGFGQSNNKTIERSATVGEFKGIHQRRAEWEQRAKEALK